LLGNLFESLVTLVFLVFAQAHGSSVGHLRVHRGEHEVDLIVERRDRRVVAFEVKLSGEVTPEDVKHLHWLKGKLGDQGLDAAGITTGPNAYRRADGIAVIPAALLGP
jgi:predicted AAA+ superfamily ATPase